MINTKSIPRQKFKKKKSKWINVTKPMKTQALIRARAMDLRNKKLITPKMYNELYKLIESPDQENWVMAEAIVDNYEGKKEAL